MYKLYNFSGNITSKHDHYKEFMAVPRYFHTYDIRLREKKPVSRPATA